MDFFVYEYVSVTRNKMNLNAVIHLADCPSCNYGAGSPTNAGYRTGLTRWHGPLETYDAAFALAEQICGQPRDCKRCLVNSYSSTF